MPVQMKVDFFRIEMPKNSGSFLDALKRASALPRDEKRNRTIRGSPVRLQEIRFDTEYVEGDFLRIKMNEIPPKASLSGEISTLDLADDEGLGNETAFLYDKKTDVLLLQRNKSGVSASSVTTYLQEAAGLSTKMQLPMVLLPDVLKKLSTITETRKIEIRFAGITNPETLRSIGGGLAEMVDVIDFYQAPAATFTLSMGRQRGSLSWLGMDRFVKWAVRSGDGIEKVEITGTTDDDKKEVLDLLEYRMVETVVVNESAKRRTKYKSRRPEMREAWKKRRSDLNFLYGSGK